AIVWAYFEHPKGIFFKCPKCKASMPKIEKCLECGHELDTKSKESGREEYKKQVAAVQHAYDVLNDFSKVALIAMEKGESGLVSTEIAIGRPIKVMLAVKEEEMAKAIERVGKPFAVEYKLDGFRIQCHKDGDKVELFTRRLENVTKQFPEVVEYVKKNVKCKSCLLDTEAVGYDPNTKKYRAFQQISQRIKRKHGIEKMQKELPVELDVFDILFYNGESWIGKQFKERRELLKKIIHEVKHKIVLVEQIITDDEKKAEKFYKESLAAGNEGVMFKNIESPYKPGARVGHMVKFKPVLESLDLVIVGAEWGTGKRSGWLSSFDLACIDENNEFLTIGKVGTGFKEKSEQGLSFDDMTKMLKPLIEEQHGRVVRIKPKVVIEVIYEEIQKSPKYSSGFALRFPRVVRLRDDKGPEDCSELSFVEQIYRTQKARGRK
ncbi:ATP-dependent DNA ligase, partial [Candidatus Woesearchaeota archaeon]|nr:ATP-dependent DNA ligase [Candidatus Woesearchaeota archaeon]